MAYKIKNKMKKENIKFLIKEKRSEISRLDKKFLTRTQSDADKQRKLEKEVRYLENKL